MLPFRLLSTGKALPSQSVTSAQLDTRLCHPRGYVHARSGIVHRYHATGAEAQSDLAAQAVRHALKRAAVSPASIDLLISTAAVPEQALPCTAARILEPAGLPSGTPAFDVNASCLGFLTATQVAASLLATGTYRRIAVVASDLASRGVDWSDPESSLIFGDGAAAMIAEAAPPNASVGIHAYRMETYPAGKALCEIPAGGTRRNPRIGAVPSDFLFHMDGKRVFRMTAELMDGFIERLFAGCPYTLADMHLVVPHQASHLAMQHLRKRLGVPADRVIDIYAHHGNQVAASLPTALHEAAASGRIEPGRPFLLLGSAAGLSLGGMVMTA